MRWVTTVLKPVILRVQQGQARMLRWLDGRPSPVPEAALEFLPDLERIIEASPPPHLRRAVPLAAAFVISLVVIASVFDVDIVVTGTGELATSDPPIVLQPLERSIIRHVSVKPGQHVQKGDLLATLDPTFTESDVSQYGAQQRALLARINRLEAERAGETYQVSNGQDPEQLLQESLFLARQKNYAARRRAFADDINKLEATLRSAINDHASLTRQLEIAQDLEGMRQELVKSQTGSRLNLLDAQNLVARASRDRQNADDRAGETRFALSARRAESEAFTEQWRSDILDELSKARNEAARVDESLIKANRMHALVEMRAPADAVVLSVSTRSDGAIAREAEPLISLVRSGSRMIAEVEIASADIGYARDGDPVKIKIDAFPYQRHGTLDGTLRSITQQSSRANEGKLAADANGSAPASPTRQATHRAYIEIAETPLGNLPRGASLIPGMTVQAEIKVGTRSAISYFLYPILKGFGESIREP